MSEILPPPNNSNLDSGSRWSRWDPHIHAPGTVLNNQFAGADAWEQYLGVLERATPQIRALGITDYYSAATYRSVCDAKQRGRLPGCDLIFPNIELRLAYGTVKGKWVNLHLLVSPEDADHVSELERFLARLTFGAHSDSFCCSEEDLVRLGKRCDSSLTDRRAQLARGTEQFKVTFEQLRQIYQESDWAQGNILIAVAGSETDGTSGVREAADSTLRQEVEKFAHIMFASSPAQREFWLGQRNMSADELRARYGGLKPCLHGCDAHEFRTVGQPDGDRFSWIKGALDFDALRQACIDPGGRAYVGNNPPARAASSQVIESISIGDAGWAKTPRIALNPGLVAIIGARGSGKTALADVIALGCDATAEKLSASSFLTRASELLGDASVTLKWQDGDLVERRLDGANDNSSTEYPRARYLSQQFVEELCSADGVTDALMREIQRVIFESHPIADRDGATTFDELLDLRAARYRQARAREESNLSDLSERIGTELEKNGLLVGLRKQIAEKKKLITSYTTDRSKLVSKGSESRVQRLAALTAAAEKIRGYLRHFATQEQSLLALKDEVDDHRNSGAPETLRQSQERHKVTGLKPEEWDAFLLDYKGDVNSFIQQYLTSARSSTTSWKGTPPASNTDPGVAFIADDAQLDKLPLTLLQAEISRLEKLVSLDKETANKFIAISKRITDESAALKRLEEKLIDCEGASERVRALVQDREGAYRRVFEAIIAEQSVLMNLYEPLMTRLKVAAGSLGKLSFTVSRLASIGNWAVAGEELLDLRQKGPFKGRGTLSQLAEEALKSAWETGDAKNVCEAMGRFRDEHQNALLEKAPVLKTDVADYRAWSKQFAKWLYGTEHITIQYSINYDGVGISKLSPGTRGIVLLLLYLALDDADDRPLIIDQPEENLDPKSIFDELVGLFTDAKNKRQVIMVTHNANLVVNTDADQIIIARVGPHVPGELPPITYVSGGLERSEIRTEVCNILEGGERAFRERARRLRVRLER